MYCKCIIALVFLALKLKVVFQAHAVIGFYLQRNVLKTILQKFIYTKKYNYATLSFGEKCVYCSCFPKVRRVPCFLTLLYFFRTRCMQITNLGIFTWHTELQMHLMSL